MGLSLLTKFPALHICCKGNMPIFSLNNFLWTKVLHANILWRKLPLCQGEEVFLGVHMVRSKPGSLAEGQGCPVVTSPLESGLSQMELGQGELLGKVSQVLWTSVAWKKKPRENLYMLNNIISIQRWAASDGYCWEVYVFFLKASRHRGVPDCISQKLTCSLYPTVFPVCRILLIQDPNC